MFSTNLRELIIKKNVLYTQCNRTDILEKIIKDGYHLRKLKLLSIEGIVPEETLMILLHHCPFPELEVISIRNKLLQTSMIRLRYKCRLRHLKKLSLKGCNLKHQPSNTQAL